VLTFIKKTRKTPRHIIEKAQERARSIWTMTIPFETLLEKWMQNPKFRAEYERIGPEMELAMSLAEARRDAELTQAELAKRMKTTQAEVARIESGRAGPKWGTIERYALALGKRPVVRLEAIGGQATRSAREAPTFMPEPITKRAAAKGPRAKAAALKPKKAAALKPKAAKRRGKRAQVLFSPEV
jgi:HTH-type transcriptional regulator/antitoxin HipB